LLTKYVFEAAISKNEQNRQIKSSLPEGAYLKHRFGERNVDLLNQYFRYEFRVWNSKSFNPAIAKMSVKAGSLREGAGAEGD